MAALQLDSLITWRISLGRRYSDGSLVLQFFTSRRVPLSYYSREASWGETYARLTVFISLTNTTTLDERRGFQQTEDYNPQDSTVRLSRYHEAAVHSV